MKKGFTLIELLVVVLIIGILAAVALPQYEKAVLKARYSNLKALTRSIADAQEIYYLANNTYATKFDELEVSLPEGKTSESTDNRYFYDWGDCRIIGSGYDSIECRNYLANMSYQIRLQYATYPRGTACITYTSDLDDIRNQLCKAETQSTSYACCESSDMREWLYQ